jgi:hypothetical protein
VKTGKSWLVSKFIEIYAIIAVVNGLGQAQCSLAVAKVGEEPPQNRFLTVVAKPAA